MCDHRERLEAAALAVEAIAPDLPVALLRMRAAWWGCEWSFERFERTGQVDPCALWGRAATVSDVAASVRQRKELSQQLQQDWATRLVRHFESEGFLDERSASSLLESAAARATCEGRKVELPADFVALLARRLAGKLPPRRGRRMPYDGVWPSWLVIQAARREFRDRRADGEKYEALIAEFAESLCVSRASVENWVSPKK